jgi:hypothetical protein
MPVCSGSGPFHLIPAVIDAHRESARTKCMNIAVGPDCIDTSIEGSVFFAAATYVVYVPNELIGRLARKGADTKAGWIELFNSHRAEILAAASKAVEAGDVAPFGHVYIKVGHFPASRM